MKTLNQNLGMLNLTNIFLMIILVGCASKSKENSCNIKSKDLIFFRDPLINSIPKLYHIKTIYKTKGKDTVEIITFNKDNDSINWKYLRNGRLLSFEDIKYQDTVIIYKYRGDNSTNLSTYINHNKIGGLISLMSFEQGVPDTAYFSEFTFKNCNDFIRKDIDFMANDTSYTHFLYNDGILKEFQGEEFSYEISNEGTKRVGREVVNERVKRYYFNKENLIDSIVIDKDVFRLEYKFWNN